MDRTALQMTVTLGKIASPKEHEPVNPHTHHQKKKKKKDSAETNELCTHFKETVEQRNDHLKECFGKFSRLIPPDRPFFARTRKTLEGITYL
jgi:hypothetical protein